MRSRVVVAVLAITLGLPAVAQAAYPGANGKIAIPGIEVMNPGGTGRMTLPASGYDPSWSPDGTKIAYATNTGGISIADADGGNAHEIIGPGTLPRSDFSPSWSPDQTKLAFLSTGGCQGDQCKPNLLYVVNADGTSPTQINADNPASVHWSPDGAWIEFAVSVALFASDFPGTWLVRPDGTQEHKISGLQGGDWSPDASKILIGRGTGGLRTMKPDGSGVTSLDSGWQALNVYRAAWSPDGSKIVAAAWPCDYNVATCHTDLFTSNADGTNIVDITNTPDVGEAGPDWQPIPQTYARPKGATPFKTFLVVAYKPCTTPDRTHGAPLAFPSCAPPQQASDSLTVGTGDANGADANSVDSVRYDVHPGNPATSADEADVAITVALRDIRNKSDLSDYTGELQLTTDLRITDKDNTPNPGGPGPGTVADAPLPATVGCAATADTTTGAVCNLTTSADVLFPGAVKEGRRAIWQLGQVQVNDGGADGVA